MWELKLRYRVPGSNSHTFHIHNILTIRCNIFYSNIDFVYENL